MDVELQDLKGFRIGRYYALGLFQKALEIEGIPQIDQDRIFLRLQQLDRDEGAA